MSEIIEAITNMIEVIADNPASILIVLGFVAIMVDALIPLQVGTQILLGGLGLFMIIIGIVVHALWLQGRG